MLVYFERFSDPLQAIEREKEIKGWRREKKLELIASINPSWADLSAEWREDESWKSLPDAEYRPNLVSNTKVSEQRSRSLASSG